MSAHSRFEAGEIMDSPCDCDRCMGWDAGSYDCASPARRRSVARTLARLLDRGRR